MPPKKRKEPSTPTPQTPPKRVVLHRRQSIHIESDEDSDDYEIVLNVHKHHTPSTVEDGEIATVKNAKKGEKKTPVKKTVVKKTAVKKTAVKKTPLKKTPLKKTPLKKTPVQKTPLKKTPVKKTPVKKPPPLPPDSSAGRDSSSDEDSDSGGDAAFFGNSVAGNGEDGGEGGGCTGAVEIRAAENRAAEPRTAATVEVAPVEAAPVEVAPVEAAPVEAAPVEAAPVEAAPVEAAPVEAAPVEAAPISPAHDKPQTRPPRDPAPRDPAPLPPPPQSYTPTYLLFLLLLLLTNFSLFLHPDVAHTIYTTAHSHLTSLPLPTFSDTIPLYHYLPPPPSLPTDPTPLLSTLLTLAPLFPPSLITALHHHIPPSHPLLPHFATLTTATTPDTSEVVDSGVYYSEPPDAVVKQIESYKSALDKLEPEVAAWSAAVALAEQVFSAGEKDVEVLERVVEGARVAGVVEIPRVVMPKIVEAERVEGEIALEEFMEVGEFEEVVEGVTGMLEEIAVRRGVKEKEGSAAAKERRENIVKAYEGEVARVVEREGDSTIMDSIAAMEWSPPAVIVSDEGDEKEGAQVDVESVKAHVKSLVLDKVSQYAADDLGKVDFARVTAGGTVAVDHTSVGVNSDLPLLKRLLQRFEVAVYGHPPEVALSVGKPVDGNVWGAGQCYQFKGAGGGDFTVKMKDPVFVSSVSVEHYGARNAPERFTVWGYKDKRITPKSKPVNLGSFKYESGGAGGDEFIQEFKVKSHKQPAFRFVKYEFTGSTGGALCLHRVRIFGKT